MENLNKSLLESIKTARSSQDEFEEMVKTTLEFTYNLRREILSSILSYTLEEIEAADIEVIREILDKYGDEDNTAKLVKKYKENYEDDEEKCLRGILLEVKKDSLGLLKSQKELTDLVKQSTDAMYEEQKSKHTEESEALRAQKIAEMKERVAGMENSIEKRNSEKMLDAMESLDDYSFLTERYAGGKEASVVKEAFFNVQKINLIMNKWTAKIPKFGYEPKTFTYFLRLEEKFLPEEYHGFNNLTIFIVMRYVGYCDPYSKTDVLKVKGIIAGLTKLVYHKFAVDGEEEAFVEMLKGLLDNFKEYAEYFTEHNQAAPNHPMRIKTDEAEEAVNKAKVLSFLKLHRIEGYDESQTAEELNKYLQEKIEEMIDAQVGPESTYVKTCVKYDEETGEEISTIVPVPEVIAEDEKSVGELLEAVHAEMETTNGVEMTTTVACEAKPTDVEVAE